MGIPGHRGRVPAESARQDLHLCDGCESDLVYPLQWEEVAAEQWNVVLRCPNCERIETGVFTQDLLDPFDDHLDMGTQALMRDLKEFTRANMAEDIDRFVAALAADAILPMDF